jgi:two-component system sensor histidine kinase AlgZ
VPLRNILGRTVMPPHFCQWRALLAVAIVSLLATALLLLGKLGTLAAVQVLPVLVYGLSLGLFCALCACLCRALLGRMSVRGAWLTAWLLVLLSAAAFSYAVGVVATVLGHGPGADAHGQFILQSVAAAAIVSVAMFRYMFIRARWQADMMSEAEARVQALQARIRPHFLFNSLNTIASLIHDNPESAERATEDLAELFRAGMRRADELIALSDELQLARKYLDMEQRRLGERLQVDWSTSELPGTARVLPMMLQPLLENAVGHGIAPRTEGGKVQVYGRPESGSLVITITNPLAPGKVRPGSGMALENIRARLALAHGGKASLITSRDAERFYAVLTVPHA